MRLPRRSQFLVATLSATVVIGAAACGEIGSSRRPPAPTAADPAGLVAASVAVPANLAAAPFDTPRQVQVPAGWRMSVWARVPGARLAAWAPDRSLLVSRPSTGQVVRLVPNASGGADQSVLLGGLDQPHGLAFDGDTLYVAESDQVDAFHYASGVASAGRTIVAGLPDSKSPDLHGAYAHALKTVVVGRDRSLFVSVGSSANASAEDRDADPQRAVILRIPPGGGPPQVFARGVRNGTGLAIAPDGALWTAVNNRDNIRYPFDKPYSGDTGSSLGRLIRGYVADHPPEALAKLTAGRDLGWPYCNSDPDVDRGVAGTAYSYATPSFVRDFETNPDGTELDCATLKPVERSFGAHSAPLGMSFVTAGQLPAPYGVGALVGVHGSWNRTPPRAPEVSFFPWSQGLLGAQQTLVGGFQAADGSRWGRPVAVVRGPDGAVYITDDYAGAVYRLVPPRR